MGLFKGSFGLFNAFLVLFGLFLPKTDFFFFKYQQKIVYIYIIKKIKMWIMAGGGGESADVDNI